LQNDRSVIGANNPGLIYLFIKHIGWKICRQFK
jgi:hypothetical protein